MRYGDVIPPPPAPKVSEAIAQVAHLALRPAAFVAKTGGSAILWLGTELQLLAQKL